MKYRIALWAAAGFLVASGWAVYFLVASKEHPMEPIVSTLLRLTCPVAIVGSHYPVSLTRLPYGCGSVFIHTSRSISATSKPVMVTSKFKSMVKRCCSSIARIDLSQPAFSAIRLSAITYARIWSSVRLSNRIVGTCSMPKSLAAATRPWPAMMVFLLLIRMGLVKPNCSMLAAI